METGNDLSEALIDDDQVEAVQRLRGMVNWPEAAMVCLSASSSSSSSLSDSDEALEAFCEVHFALSALSAAEPTDVGTAASLFLKVLDFAGSRTVRFLLLPLWILAMLGPELCGPVRDDLVPPALGRLMLVLLIASTPLQMWIHALSMTWPSALDSAIRLAATKEEVGNAGGGLEMVITEDSNIEDPTTTMPPMRRPKNKALGACRVLRVMAPVVVVAAFVGLALAVASYVLNAATVASSCTELAAAEEDDDLRSLAVASWFCAWRSATDFAARLALAIALPLAILPPTLFLAHAIALPAALRATEKQDEESTDEEEDDDDETVLSEANALWRRPVGVSLLVGSVAVGLTLRSAILHASFVPLAVSAALSLPVLATVAAVNASLHSRTENLELKPSSRRTHFFVSSLLRPRPAAALLLLLLLLSSLSTLLLLLKAR